MAKRKLVKPKKRVKKRKVRKKTTKRRAPSLKTLKTKCDRIFSKIIRHVGVCQYPGCDSTANLQCCHIISRKYSLTRCDERNAICMCAKHHLHLDHVDRAWWWKILEHHNRIQDYLDLRELLEEKKGHKVDWERMYDKLTARYNQLLKGRG